MLKIGLTGGIGVGKSTVSKVFSLLNVPVYEADSRAKFLIEHDLFIVKSIQGLLGDNAYLSDGSYNKSFVAECVFNNKLTLEKLNHIVHPAVALDFEDFCKKNSDKKYILKEAALMNRNQGLDKIIVVTSPLELRICRIKARDTHRKENQISEIIKNQKSQEEFLEMADFEIRNNDTEMLLPQILEIHRQILTFS